ncbi:hypothetical protein HPP92_007711 [Vanilla planifolia]|uniref:Protein kinase domain-containing protein n=1 Tax=Vanilla planifolia TaxID=51239 RepID=A0A835RN51_VANPL|nr:hypothetical protein HPP92_007798 [Vanilla planifolia]KAG0490848.1 hypothetical protein HPP92_007711 [Vanilla planifolia]
MSSTSIAAHTKERTKAKQRNEYHLPATAIFEAAKSISRLFCAAQLCVQGGSGLGLTRKPSSCNWSSTQRLTKSEGGRVKNGKPYFGHCGCRVTTSEITRKWRVDLSQLYFGPRFSSGAHSTLYRGVYRNQLVAVKTIRLPDANADDDESRKLTARLEKQFVRERTFLSHLRHRNVIKLAGAWKESDVFFLVTEYLSGGSLRTLLHKQEGRPLSLDKLIAIALEIARGMEYIHSRGVVHRDLKPENILLDQDLRVKVADFGVACKESCCGSSGDVPAGTYRWMAPEMIKRKRHGRKVDVYSFGILLWEMLTGCIPYEEMTPVQAAFAVVHKRTRPAFPEDCPIQLRALIERCWSSSPEKRPEFWQIVEVLERFEATLGQVGTK